MELSDNNDSHVSSIENENDKVAEGIATSPIASQEPELLNSVSWSSQAEGYFPVGGVKKVIKHALRQQAKRRRKNTNIAAGVQGSLSSEVGPDTDDLASATCLGPATPDLSPHETACVQASYRQPTMAEVLASIPGFNLKPRKRGTKKLSAAAQLEQTKEGCVDLETPDSILVQANLRLLLNKHTFSNLPPLYQYKLLQLLPHVDRSPSRSDLMFRLSSSGLNNEFFARACMDWRERLAEGEFTPENQVKLKAEQDKEKAKLDPWKLKHFEPMWGESLQEWPSVPLAAEPETSPPKKKGSGGRQSKAKVSPPQALGIRRVGAVTRAVSSQVGAEAKRSRLEEAVPDLVEFQTLEVSTSALHQEERKEQETPVVESRTVDQGEMGLAFTEVKETCSTVDGTELEEELPGTEEEIKLDLQVEPETEQPVLTEEESSLTFSEEKEVEEEETRVSVPEEIEEVLMEVPETEVEVPESESITPTLEEPMLIEGDRPDEVSEINENLEDMKDDTDGPPEVEQIDFQEGLISQEEPVCEEREINKTSDLGTIRKAAEIQVDGDGRWEVIPVDPNREVGEGEEVEALLEAAWEVVGGQEPSVIPCKEELEVRLQESRLPVVGYGGQPQPTPNHLQGGHVKLELEVTLTPEVDSQVSSSEEGKGKEGQGESTNTTTRPVTVIPPTTIVCLPPPSAPAPVCPLPPRLPPVSTSALPYLALATSTPVRAVHTKMSTKTVGRRQGSTRPNPPGTVNLERSYQICQAVIQNSPNREALQTQLKLPPSLLAKQAGLGPGVGSPAVGRRSNSAPPPHLHQGPDTSCLCSLRAFRPCLKCGKYCHYDCISSANICIRCDIR